MRVLGVIVSLFLIAGCAGHAATAPVVEVSSTYMVSLDPAPVENWPLETGLTVSRAVRLACEKYGRTGPMTVVYMQRGPEGMTRRLIDFDGALMPRNLSRDYVLRAGDELILPAVGRMAKPQ